MKRPTVQTGEMGLISALSVRLGRTGWSTRGHPKRTKRRAFKRHSSGQTKMHAQPNKAHSVKAQKLGQNHFPGSFHHRSPVLHAATIAVPGENPDLGYSGYRAGSPAGRCAAVFVSGDFFGMVQVAKKASMKRPTRSVERTGGS